MKKFLFLLILYFTLTASSWAIVENKRISLDEAIEITLKSNPNIQIEKLNVEIAKNEIKASSHLQNPSVGTFQNMGKTGKTEPQTLGVDYVIEILKRGKRKDLAKTKAQIAANNQEFIEYNMIAEVKKAYVDLLLKKAILKIIEEQTQLSNEIYETAKKGFEKGLVLKPDVIQAKINLNRSIMYLNMVKTEVISSQNHFNLTMNTKEINYDTKEDDLNDNFSSLGAISPKKQIADFDSIIEFALNNRKDLKKAKEGIISAQENLKVVKSKLIPDLELQGGYAYQTKGYNEDKVNESGAYAAISLINVPLVYHYQPEIKNANIEIEKAKLNYENTKTDVIRDITDAWEKYSIARTNLAFYDNELLADSKELLRESKRSLDKKEIDITNFLVSKKLYLELVLGYKNALNDYYISYFELLKEMNTNSIENL